MKKRYMVFGLSAVLAVALAVPALGGPTNPIASISASAKKIANKALKTAKAAQKTANTALSTANSATSEAKSAESDAKKAQTAANTAQTTANLAKTTADAAKAAAAAAEANANTRISGSTEVLGKIETSNTTTAKSSSVSCPAEDPVLSGGYFIEGESNKITVVDDNNQLYGHGWFVTAETINGQGTPTWRITAIAMCGTK